MLTKAVIQLAFYLICMKEMRTYSNVVVCSVDPPAVFCILLVLIFAVANPPSRKNILSLIAYLLFGPDGFQELKPAPFENRGAPQKEV
jgi:hypothetical protein